MKKKKKVAADSKGYRTLCDQELKIHPALKEYFGYCLKKAAIRHSFLMSEALSSEGILAPQLGILLILKTSEPLNQISLGEQMGIDKASMVKFIDGLEKLGLVERMASLEDRRVKRIKITSRGERFAEERLKKSIEVTEKFLSPLTAEERRVLRTALPKLLEE